MDEFELDATIERLTDIAWAAVMAISNRSDEKEALDRIDELRKALREVLTAHGPSAGTA